MVSVASYTDVIRRAATLPEPLPPAWPSHRPMLLGRRG